MNRDFFMVTSVYKSIILMYTSALQVEAEKPFDVH